MNVTVRNVITSMRMISAVDWAEFFESVSLVDAALRADSDFAEMDFPTRDRYRHAIEELARGSGQPELEVARHAIAAAKRAAAEPRSGGSETAGAEQEPGYYLISKGRRAIEKEMGFRVPISEWLVRANAAAGNPGLCRRDRDHQRVHSGPAAAWRGGSSGSADGFSSLLALLAVIPASDAAVALVNRGVTKCLRSQNSAGHGACRRSAREPAHDSRGADALDDAR